MESASTVEPATAMEAAAGGHSTSVKPAHSVSAAVAADRVIVEPMSNRHRTRSVEVVVAVSAADDVRRSPSH